MKIAMWSGPRNLSTAMMYSFGARGDFAIWDEPFYGAYLAATGSDHPMREEIIAAGEVNPDRVAARCAGAIPDGKPHLYMKHMPHHMVEDFPLDWAKDCVNIHLIRHPAYVIASYGAKRDEVTLEDIGYSQQLDILRRFGGYVVDSFDIRKDPETMLRRLCKVSGIAFDPAMLGWPAGPKPFDGAWAPHWYDAVHKSTGFAGPEGPLPELDAVGRNLLDQAVPLYEAMRDEAENLA